MKKWIVIGLALVLVTLAATSCSTRKCTGKKGKRVPMGIM